MELVAQQIAVQNPLPKAPPTETKEARINRLRAEKLKDFTKKNQPKRAATAYVLYYLDKKKDATLNQPENSAGVGTGSLFKLVGAMWQKASPEEKKPYEELARQARVKREADLKAFQNGPLKAFMEGELTEYVRGLDAADE